MIDKSLAKKLNFHYLSQYPYPHIVIDDFIESAVLNKSLNEMIVYPYWGYDNTNYSADHQINKFFAPWCYDPCLQDIKNEAPTTYELMNYFNSFVFIAFLEELTGIQNLLPDISFYGGAVHKLKRGGKLDVHADYTFHPQQKTYRRLTMLLYMNKNWDKSWGSDLELWERDMSRCVKKIEPLFNRFVLFDVTENTFHGHPHPLDCPEDVSRFSFTMSYFTKEKPEIYNVDHTGAYWQEIPKK